MAKYQSELKLLGWFIIILIFVTIKSRLAIVNPQFFAEDGEIFFSQQYNHSLPLLFIPYAGYLNFIPRLVAWISSFFDILYAPLIYNASALLIASIIILYFAKKSYFFNSLIVILTFALLVTDGEEYGSITYILWFSQILLFILIVYPMHQEFEKLYIKFIKWILIIICALTGPFSIFLFLILIFIWTVSLFKPKKTIFSDIALIKHHIKISNAITLALTAIVQLVYLFYFSKYFPYNESRVHINIHHILYFFQLISYGLEYRLFGHILLPYFFDIFLFIFLVLAISNKNLSKESRGILILFLIYSFLDIASAAFAVDWNLKSIESMGGDRYFFLFKILFWCMFPLFLNRLGISNKKSLLLTILFLVLNALFNPYFVIRFGAVNYNWEKESEIIKRNIGPIKVPINPYGWNVSIIKTNYKNCKNLPILHKSTLYNIESISLNNTKSLYSFSYNVQTSNSNNTPLPLYNNQTLQIILPNGLPEGTINAISILQGNYNNTADGILKVKVCNDAKCSQGEKPLSRSTDNSFFAIQLTKPLNITKGKVSVTIELINSTKPEAIWLYSPIKDYPQIITKDGSKLPNKAVQLNFIYQKPDSFKFSIAKSSGDFLQLSGWAVDSVAKNIDSGVIAVIDNKYFYPLQNGLQQTDVSTAFNNPNYEYSGFNGTIPIGDLNPGKHILTLRIINYHETGYFESKPIEFTITNTKE